MVEEKLERTIPKKNCIRFWERILFDNKAFMSISTIAIIEATIKHLKEEKK